MPDIFLTANPDGTGLLPVVASLVNRFQTMLEKGTPSERALAMQANYTTQSFYELEQTLTKGPSEMLEQMKRIGDLNHKLFWAKKSSQESKNAAAAAFKAREGLKRMKAEYQSIVQKVKSLQSPAPSQEELVLLDKLEMWSKRNEIDENKTSSMDENIKTLRESYEKISQGNKAYNKLVGRFNQHTIISKSQKLSPEHNAKEQLEKAKKQRWEIKKALDRITLDLGLQLDPQSGQWVRDPNIKNIPNYDALVKSLDTLQKVSPDDTHKRIVNQLITAAEADRYEATLNQHLKTFSDKYSKKLNGPSASTSVTLDAVVGIVTEGIVKINVGLKYEGNLTIKRTERGFVVENAHGLKVKGGASVGKADEDEDFTGGERFRLKAGVSANVEVDVKRQKGVTYATLEDLVVDWCGKTMGVTGLIARDPTLALSEKPGLDWVQNTVRMRSRANEIKKALSSDLQKIGVIGKKDKLGINKASHVAKIKKRVWDGGAKGSLYAGVTNNLLNAGGSVGLGVRWAIDNVEYHRIPLLDDLADSPKLAKEWSKKYKNQFPSDTGTDFYNALELQHRAAVYWRKEIKEAETALAQSNNNKDKKDAEERLYIANNALQKIQSKVRDWAILLDTEIDDYARLQTMAASSKKHYPQKSRKADLAKKHELAGVKSAAEYLKAKALHFSLLNAVAKDVLNIGVDDEATFSGEDSIFLENLRNKIVIPRFKVDKAADVLHESDHRAKRVSTSFKKVKTSINEVSFTYTQTTEEWTNSVESAKTYKAVYKTVPTKMAKIRVEFNNKLQIGTFFSISTLFNKVDSDPAQLGGSLKTATANIEAGPLFDFKPDEKMIAELQRAVNAFGADGTRYSAIDVHLTFANGEDETGKKNRPRILRVVAATEKGLKVGGSAPIPGPGFKVPVGGHVGYKQRHIEQVYFGENTLANLTFTWRAKKRPKGSPDDGQPDGWETWAQEGVTVVNTLKKLLDKEDREKIDSNGRKVSLLHRDLDFWIEDLMSGNEKQIKTAKAFQQAFQKATKVYDLEKSNYNAAKKNYDNLVANPPPADATSAVKKTYEDNKKETERKREAALKKMDDQAESLKTAMISMVVAKGGKEDAARLARFKQRLKKVPDDITDRVGKRIAEEVVKTMGLYYDETKHRLTKRKWKFKKRLSLVPADLTNEELEQIKMTKEALEQVKKDVEVEKKGTAQEKEALKKKYNGLLPSKKYNSILEKIRPLVPDGVTEETLEEIKKDIETEKNGTNEEKEKLKKKYGPLPSQLPSQKYGAMLKAEAEANNQADLDKKHFIENKFRLTNKEQELIHERASKKGDTEEDGVKGWAEALLFVALKRVVQYPTEENIRFFEKAASIKTATERLQTLTKTGYVDDVNETLAMVDGIDKMLDEGKYDISDEAYLKLKLKKDGNRIVLDINPIIKKGHAQHVRREDLDKLRDKFMDEVFKDAFRAVARDLTFDYINKRKGKYDDQSLIKSLKNAIGNVSYKLPDAQEEYGDGTREWRVITNEKEIDDEKKSQMKKYYEDKYTVWRTNQSIMDEARKKGKERYFAFPVDAFFKLMAKQGVRGGSKPRLDFAKKHPSPSRAIPN